MKRDVSNTIQCVSLASVGAAGSEADEWAGNSAGQTWLPRETASERTPGLSGNVVCSDSQYLSVTVFVTVQQSLFFTMRSTMKNWTLENKEGFWGGKYRIACVLSAQVETEGLRRSIQNLGVLLTTAAVAHTSVATGEGLRHAATGQHHTITVTTKDKVLTLNYFACCLQHV